MLVALSMPTLVPGISRGSETYARRLARGLFTRARGKVTALAPDAGEGLPTRVVDAYPSSATITGRPAATTRATVAPARLHEGFQGFDVVPYPPTTPVPRPHAARIVITLHGVECGLGLVRALSWDSAVAARERARRDTRRAGSGILIP